MKYLLIYSSRFGYTKKIAQKLEAQWTAAGITVDIVNLADAPILQSGEYDKIIIGASIRYGHYAAALAPWIIRNQHILNSTPSAFYSVSILANKPHRNTPQTHTYTRKFFAKSPWQPQTIGIFAGELHYARYNLIDRYMMRLVMKLNKGETNLNAHIEYTDWKKVREFGEQILKLTN
ncbi:menaquinone-dependent protoporphyrinogen IX dehydrogenase [Snodgrassella alvi]|uniref:menaquinone-dependent protoporphyrinogen IX dehydrogenase n=1 Tax=Snodgrassella alvi TaxID=1196083 RepID=UPI0034608913